jgi:hypothetical protein
MHADSTQSDPTRLRELASWYRDFAERAGSPAIWEARLRTARKPEAKGDLVERTLRSGNPGDVG